MKKLSTYILFIPLIVFTSCIDRITPDFAYEEQVFISGLFTNEEDVVSVRIQKTVPVTNTTFSAVNDAQISLLTRDASNTVSLVTDSFIVTDGNYKTEEMVTPIIGNTYWIEAILQDQTVLRSAEEILNPPVPILNMVQTNNTVEVHIESPIKEQNYYLYRVEIFRDDMVLSDDIEVGIHKAINEKSEKLLDIDDINTGDTIRVSLHNINFNTFQFYSNILNNQDNELGISSLFLPTNLVGNITNVATNQLVLGNFGVAGFSTMTKEF